MGSMGQSAARFLLVGLAALAIWAKPANVRGVLEVGTDSQPVIETADGRRLTLTGDPDTMKVLRDDRLKGRDFEVRGQFEGPAKFKVGPIYTDSMWVWKDGKRHQISYWCGVCSIRNYTPGICDCCQDETELDLREVDPPQN